MVYPQWVFVEQELLFTRLRPVEAGYDMNRGCMEGTRQYILKQVLDWVVNSLATSAGAWSNTYWLHGPPGIGKTSLAHSICEKLHNENYLAASFFCRRDDPYLDGLTIILPTLINALAGTSPPFRRLVAARLRNDSNMTSKTMTDSLFLDLIETLPQYPEHPLVIVIDALDEYGDTRSRPVILGLLTKAAELAPWLKVIVTSRPEIDIQHVFDGLPLWSHLRYDLTTDKETNADLRTFARCQFDLVASHWRLPTSWPKESDFNRVISLANGLFIFIQTLILVLERGEDPKEALKRTLHDAASTGLEPLYGLYAGILTAKIAQGNAAFQRVIGVLLSSHRPLREDTIAELAGVEPYLVKHWVDALGSLLYRDEGTNEVIRVRHLSISDYFVSDECPHNYRVRLEESNLQLGIVCIKTMLRQLRFNICELEDSRLANADITDLPFRIKQYISDPLQYSSIYWSNHLCFTPDSDNENIWKLLKEFFERLYPLFWIEVLSILGVVEVGEPSLGRVILWLRVSTT
jgi:DNA polymerase III delta prime subunit